MSNTASKLKPMDLGLKDEFLIHLIFASLPKEYETFVVNYKLQPDKWDISNHKCLMVAKSTISDAIRGSIPNCDIATEYLKKVENQFTSSSKAYASTLIKKLFNEKYSGGGIREHILKMSNTTSKLKPMDMELKDEFLVHLIFASLPKEYETLLLITTYSQISGALRSSLPCVCKKRRGLRAHMVTPSTM